MDITEDVTYRGLLLTKAVGGSGGDHPVVGYRLTRARYSDVSVHGYTEKRSLDDGMDASDVFMGVRQVVLQGEVYAASKAALFDMLDDLRLTFTPTDAYNESPRQRGYLPLQFQQPTAHLVHWPLGFIPRELNCRPSAQPEFDLQFGALTGIKDEGGYVCPFVLRLEAKDPRFYTRTDAVFNFGTGTGTSGVHLPRNRGNYPAPVSLILSTSDTAKKTFTLVGVQTNMTVTIPAGSGVRTVIVDGYAKVCTLTAAGTETLRMDLITFDASTTWPRAVPTPEGSPDILFDWTFAGGGLAAGSRMFFREAWV